MPCEDTLDSLWTRLYAAHSSEWMIVPGATWLLINGSRVAASLCGTISMYPREGVCNVSTNPNIQICSVVGLPRWCWKEFKFNCSNVLCFYLLLVYAETRIHRFVQQHLVHPRQSDYSEVWWSILLAAIGRCQLLYVDPHQLPPWHLLQGIVVPTGTSLVAISAMSGVI